jgi:hypothetical protein
MMMQMLKKLNDFDLDLLLLLLLLLLLDHHVDCCFHHVSHLLRHHVRQRHAQALHLRHSSLVRPNVECI